MQRQWGYGHGYKYPHVFPDGWVNQDYLPDTLRGASFYHPKEHGAEQRLTAWWQKHRQSRPQGSTKREMREREMEKNDD
jgi:putative ATPase